MSSTMTSDELANEFGVGRWTIYEAAKTGGIDLGAGRVVAPIRVGRRVLWPRRPIEEALGQSRNGLTSDPSTGETAPALEVHSNGNGHP